MADDAPLSVTICGNNADVVALCELLMGALPGLGELADVERARAAHAGAINDPAGLVVVQFRRRGAAGSGAAQPVLDVDALEYMLYDSAFEWAEQYRTKDKPWLRNKNEKVRIRKVKQEKLF